MAGNLHDLPDDLPGLVSEPQSARDAQEELRNTISRELRSIGQQLLIDARAEFRRLAQHQEAALEQLLGARGAGSSTDAGGWGPDLGVDAGDAGDRPAWRPASSARKPPKSIAWGLDGALAPATSIVASAPLEASGARGRSAFRTLARSARSGGRVGISGSSGSRLGERGSASSSASGKLAIATRRLRSKSRFTVSAGPDLVAALDEYRRGGSGENVSGAVAMSARSMRTLLQAFIKSEMFDQVMGVMQIAHAVCIGVQADHAARHYDEPLAGFSLALDVFFCVLFSVELGLRVFAEGRQFFSCSGPKAMWNLFDASIVAFSSFDVVARLSASGQQPSSGITGDVGFLRLLRLVRVVRLVRFIRLFPQLKSMVYLVRASVASFFWSLMLMFIMVYGFAVYFTEVVSEVQRVAHEGSESPQASSYWGTMADSMLSLFMAMTGGDDWSNFLQIFRTDATLFWSNALVFSFYVAFMVLVMLNLVTGVFVDGAARMYHNDKEHELLRVAADAFNKADVDHNSSITHEQFCAIIEESAFDEYCQVLGISVRDADQLFYVLDDDGSGQVDCLEFMRGSLRLRGNARAKDLAAFQYMVKVSFAEVLAAVGELAASVEQIRRQPPLEEQGGTSRPVGVSMQDVESC